MKFFGKLVAILILVLALVSLWKSRDPLTNREGGNSSTSPDGKWYVRIEDGQSRFNQLPYAEVSAYSTEQGGKGRTFGPFHFAPSKNRSWAHWRFPQPLIARMTRIEWEASRPVFRIRYELYKQGIGLGRQRTLRYDIESGEFSVQDESARTAS